jgi:MYXO-CTERM domain-containing protein
VIGTWTVQAGATLVNGYGVRVGSQGAALLYQDDAKRGDMQVVVTMTPEKTSGAGFGSPGSSADGANIQKSDIFIKYDPRTQTGYSLRYWRTTQSATACLYQLFRIDNGAGTPLNDTQVLTGVFRDNTELTMKVTGDQLTVEGHNTSNGETLSLSGTIAPNDFGGAGVAWGGTVSRGNSNVYSKFEISYPGATVPPCQTPPPEPPTTTPPPVRSNSGCGCASSGAPRGGALPPALLLLAGLLAVRRRRRR